MTGYSIDSADIVRVLARNGPTHRCPRCAARMLVRYESGLCVRCFNGLARSGRVEALVEESRRSGGRLRQLLRTRELEIVPIPVLR